MKHTPWRMIHLRLVEDQWYVDYMMAYSAERPRNHLFNLMAAIGGNLP